MITASVMKDLMIVHMYREETSSETVTAGANNNLIKNMKTFF